MYIIKANPEQGGYAHRFLSLIMTTHKTGKKITRSHTSVTDAAERVIKIAESMPEVTKIALGIIKNIGTGKPSIKFHPMTGGFRAIIRGNTSIQEIFVYAKEPEKVQKVLKKAY
jgi:hypothetical protein